MENLIDKSKHTVKIGNHPHTNAISKPSNHEWRRTQMWDIWNLFAIKRSATEDNHMYIYGLLYQNLMITTYQKSIIDIHTKKKKESKCNT